MIRLTIRKSVSSLAILFAATSVLAQGSIDYGKREFESKCIACHAADGKGRGDFTELTKTPPDLTTLAKRNGGVFPLQRLYEVIDGRAQVPWHGPRDMPIWGRDYVSTAGEHLEYYPERFARMRILALIDYLSRIQQK